MRHSGARFGNFLLGVAVISLVGWAGSASAQSGARKAAAEQIVIIGLQGSVEVMPTGATDWVLTQTNQALKAAYRLRTGRNSRVWLLWSDHSVVSFGESTLVEILPPQDHYALPGLHILQGLLSFFHRDKPGRIRVITRGAVAGVEGTEFVLAVNASDNHERGTLSVIDGQVQLTNEQGTLLLTNNQQGVAETGKAPVRTAGFVANNILQWCLYYPAVLDPNELRLSPDEEQALKESLAAYRDGDLLQAMATYPAGRIPGSTAEQLYYAALLLSVGQVDRSETALAALQLGAPSELAERLALALRTLMAAVKRQPNPSTMKPRLASEYLAASYYEQSRAQGDESLKVALDFARKATRLSPDLGFAWERVAELEFGFGHASAAKQALDRSLHLASRNAQTLSLRGFLLAGQNRPRQAVEWFNQAIAVDPALGNAWLGRGLCRMRRGDSTGGVKDLTVAAALEPQRALLRSYLGKAYTTTDSYPTADKELKLAINLDRHDPTAWLYSALLKQQENRINQAIGDLEAAQERNDNRSLFRSRLLLDQDRAVSSANLASIYRDAGMTDVSVREASRAVTYDYANAAAHLFLADSYNALRDPTRFNLRYETVWFNELLLANLLSPIGGGRLAQHVSQQEYSRLFQADGLGIANSTLGRSDNSSVRELVSQYGTFGGTSYAFDLDYQNSDGVRPNNDLNSIEWYTTFKQQITSQDTMLAVVKFEDYSSGDNFQYYDPDNARRNFKFEEYQQPIVVGGWHHEWSPNNHSLLLGGRIVTEQRFSDTATPQLVLIKDSAGNVIAADGATLDASYRNDMEIYLAELNHVLQSDRISLSLGGRWQGGSFAADSVFSNPGQLGFLFNPQTPSSSDEGFQRLTAYGYLTVEPFDRLWLIGGTAYDDLTYPGNFRHPPLSPGESHTCQLGPKAALVWNPVSLVTLRGAYTKSLGGVSADESYRLEQTQVAGFPQAFRSLISESIVGSVAAPEYETYSAALDFKFPSGTYVGILVQRLTTDVDRTIGVFSWTNGTPPLAASSTTEERLRYYEDSIGVGINQLLGRSFAVGASLKYDRVKFNDDLPGVPVSALSAADRTDHAELYETTGYVLYNHPSGFFARADATWYHQNNTGAFTPGHGDDFVQENLYLGYRFLHRRAEVMFGILNLSDQDYHLYSLTAYPELPRERSFILRLNFIF
ncbi:MAG TPA: FecR domain-containing protein [Candidatus Paceibacterota bacterium]|nr:FecR domain-containing protein [Verrucomicrobiota bacterium]HSA11770.1 FecR domain-containing protein [Candidatus Paceibacterota bacterium]